MFVRPALQEVLHVPESPVPLNSPELLNKSHFKFNSPLPVGEVVRDIIHDQDRFYLELVKRFNSVSDRSKKVPPTNSLLLRRNASTLYNVVGRKPLRIATQSFIDNEIIMDQLNSPRDCSTPSGGDFTPKSFHPASPNFDSQHSLLDFTHVSRIVD